MLERKYVKRLRSKIRLHLQGVIKYHTDAKQVLKAKAILLRK